MINSTVSLRTVETAFEREIELGMSEVVLFVRNVASRTPLPSSLLFAIPLMPDMPQSIQTPHSSLSHILTAVLHPTDRCRNPVSKSLTVHTKRYTSHTHSLVTSPETRTINNPTLVKIELPRTTFTAEEVVPLYVTIPPPEKELVDQGLRLRNIRAELIRVVKVKRENHEDENFLDLETEVQEMRVSNASDILEGPSTNPEKSPGPSTDLPSPFFLGSSYRTVLSRSGAQCRFHSARPVQMRFVLRQFALPESSSDFQSTSTPPDHSQHSSDAECPSISQTTLLHSVTFRANIHVSFVDISNRTERISSVSIPISILPSPAPLPEIAASVDAAYRKKHDRPPAKTNRFEDDDFSAPRYSEGEAGPSPPFEEREAPPPFSSSSASRLPTFLESESEIIIPHNTADEMAHVASLSPVIVGEGEEFGFAMSQQFDGHSETSQRSSTPPPTLEMASMDTDVTLLAEMPEPERSIEVLGIVLDQQENVSAELPPPPPAMDDPSDPPPSIDSDFRSPEATRPTSPHPSPPPRLHTPSPTPVREQSSGHAPPPYLVPDSHGEQEHVTRPPPYVD